MNEWIALHIETVAAYAPMWGFLIIFILMTVESSFIPFPSEVVMIPAGFLAWRGGLTTGDPLLDCGIAVVVGTAGSLAGAYINYYLALWLGRPLLYRYGKYMFLPPPTLERAEEVFREYGDLTTFVCRLLPAIRQLISIPAGLARMNFWRFTFFTGLGAAIWVAILTAAGAWFGHLSGELTYPELVNKGVELIHKHYIWLLLALIIGTAGYLMVHKKIMHAKKAPAPQQ